MGKGCNQCNNTGYRGRIGVYELLEMNNLMADALRRNDSAGFVQASQKAAGFTPLTLCALDYASQGITSLSEVFRLSSEMEDAPTEDTSEPEADKFSSDDA